MVLNNKLFDVLKWICIFVLPALATFVRVIFSIWNIPYGEEIAATIVAINAFLGAIIGVSAYNYNKSESSGNSATKKR